MLRVVPRPDIGSSRAPLPGWSTAVGPAVTFSSSLVNCSLVLPGYFGMVTRSSSKRSGRGMARRPQQIAAELVRGQDRRGAAELALDNRIGGRSTDR